MPPIAIKRLLNAIRAIYNLYKNNTGIIYTIFFFLMENVTNVLSAIIGSGKTIFL